MGNPLENNSIDNNENLVSQPDENGFFGPYGGRFVPEPLVSPLEELTEAFLRHRDDEIFREELAREYLHYSGRPTPLYHAERLSEFLGATVLLTHPVLAQNAPTTVNDAIKAAADAARAAADAAKAAAEAAKVAAEAALAAVEAANGLPSAVSVTSFIECRFAYSFSTSRTGFAKRRIPSGVVRRDNSLGMLIC